MFKEIKFDKVSIVFPDFEITMKRVLLFEIFFLKKLNFSTFMSSKK